VRGHLVYGGVLRTVYCVLLLKISSVVGAVYVGSDRVVGVGVLLSGFVVRLKSVRILRTDCVLKTSSFVAAV